MTYAILKKLSLAVLCASGGLMAAHAQEVPLSANVGPVAGNGFELLMQQADFWETRNRPDMVKQVLERALQASPNSEVVLFRLARHAQQHDPKSAANWIERLAKANPNSSYLAQLRTVATTSKLDARLLAEARSLASRGMTDEASQRYMELFGNGPPPQELELEYYQTLAGVGAYWSEAREGLERILQAQPGNAQVQMAYAQMLTYRPSTRREGIQRLSSLAEKQPQARAAWRQALLWLGATEEDRPLYERYAAANPTDTEVSEKFVSALLESQANEKGRDRSSAFESLSAGRNTAAMAGFRKALEDDPKDAEAWGGLGIVQLRGQNFQAAATSLRKAIELDPQNKQKWQTPLASAEFYGKMAVARSARDAGRLSEAERQARALAQTSGERGQEASQLLADILLRSNKPDEAERLYRQQLQRKSGDRTALLGLYNSLTRQGRMSDARQMLQDYPVLASQSNINLDQIQAQSLAEQAKALQDKGELQSAAELYAQALSLAPANPWVRLGYARLLDQSGEPQQANYMMEALQDRPDAESQHAIALLAAEQKRWGDARNAVLQIPAAKRTTDINELLSRSELNERISSVRNIAARGNPVQTRQALRNLYDNMPSGFTSRGSVAATLAELGEPSLALSIVRPDLLETSRQRPAADYFAHVSVLVKAGQEAEADAFLRTLERRSDLSASDRQGLQSLRNGFAIASADRQRQDGNLAGAYDTLIAALETQPEDPELMLAMGRVYSTGKMPKEALEVYEYVLQQSPGRSDAVSSAVSSALELNDPRRASRLLTRSNAALDEPMALYLAARVAQSDGRNRQAITLLEMAKRKQQERGQVLPVGVLRNEGPLLARNNNPFRQEEAQIVLPGSDVVARNPFRRSLADQQVSASADPLLSDIERTLAQIREKTATQLVGGINLRARDGEAGLSRLTEIAMPTTLSTVPLDNGRLEISATPIHLDAGTPGDGPATRFGSFTVAQGALSLFDQIRTEAYTEYAADSAAFAAYEIAKAAWDLNPVGTEPTLVEQPTEPTWNGLVNQWQALLTNNVGYSPELAQKLAERLRNSSLARSTAAYKPKAQDASGVALNLAYKGDSFSADIGSTPLGFERRNLVGGVKWTPKVGENGQISVGASRRAVTDSLLSYAGTRDPLTGKTWGGVTKTGGELQYAYDNGEAGFYVGGDYSVYRGKNVADNSSMGMNTGAYLRPIKDKERELQVGVNLGWMSYDKNLGNYTMGHGGYFSPQSYVGIAFPVQYTAQRDKWNMKLKASVGYQSFSQDSAAYFPTDGELQGALDSLEQYVTDNEVEGVTVQARYPSNSKSGMAMNLGAGLEYQVGKQTKIGGSLGHDTFGDYKETTGVLYLKHNLEK